MRNRIAMHASINCLAKYQWLAALLLLYPFNSTFTAST